MPLTLDLPTAVRSGRRPLLLAGAALAVALAAAGGVWSAVGRPAEAAPIGGALAGDLAGDLASDLRAADAAARSTRAGTQVVSAVELGESERAAAPARMVEAPDAAPTRPSRAPRRTARPAPRTVAPTARAAAPTRPAVAVAPTPTAPERVAPETAAPEPTVVDEPIVAAPSAGAGQRNEPAPAPRRRGGWSTTADVIRNAPFPINP